MSVRVYVEVSAGELIDRITILELKCAHFGGGGRAEISRQLAEACDIRDRSLGASPELGELTRELAEVNRTLWEAEDELRECERNARFHERFVELARCVYRTNDRRAQLKRCIDELVGSELREHKLYSSQGDG